MENNDLNDIDDDFDSGIELDKIEVPKSAATPISETPAKAPISETPAKTEIEVDAEVDAEVEPKKGLKFIVVIVVFFIFLGAALFFLSQQDHIKTSFLGQGPNSSESAVEYHAIGPIITNLGADKHIKISLMIKNRNKQKQQIAVTESIIRDKILMFLTSQDTKRVINESDLGKVQSYINNELTHMLQSDYKDEIVLKELMVY